MHEAHLLVCNGVIWKDFFSFLVSQFLCSLWTLAGHYCIICFAYTQARLFQQKPQRRYSERRLSHRGWSCYACTRSHFVYLWHVYWRISNPDWLIEVPNLLGKGGGEEKRVPLVVVFFNFWPFPHRESYSGCSGIGGCTSFRASYVVHDLCLGLFQAHFERSLPLNLDW